MPNAKLRAKVDRYSFFVRFLPPLLHTGLARRTNISITFVAMLRIAMGEKPSPVVCDCATYTGRSQITFLVDNQALPR
jgi:hypothetical protein